MVDIELLNKVCAHIDDHKEKKKAISSEEYYFLAYAKYYLKVNDLDKVEEHINLTEDLYKKYGKDSFNDCELHNNINIAELNYARENRF